MLQYAFYSSASKIMTIIMNKRRNLGSPIAWIVTLTAATRRDMFRDSTKTCQWVPQQKKLQALIPPSCSQPTILTTIKQQKASIDRINWSIATAIQRTNCDKNDRSKYVTKPAYIVESPLHHWMIWWSKGWLLRPWSTLHLRTRIKWRLLAQTLFLTSHFWHRLYDNNKPACRKDEKENS